MSRLTPVLVWVLAFQLAVPAAFACGPFDYRIIRAEPGGATRGLGSRGLGDAKEIQAPPLAWAAEVTRDAKTIHSDAGFFSTPGGGYWSYATEDSGLSKANTLLEFFGYYSRVLAIDGRQNAMEDAIRTKIFDPKTAEKWAGISINTLRAYPNAGENNPLVERAVNDVFGLPAAPLILEMMRRQNANPTEYGVKYWTRPAYLDSDASPGVAAPCMAIAYGQDYFTNNNVARDVATVNKQRTPPINEQQFRMEYLAPAFGIAMRSSIVDYAAAQAIKNLDPATGKPKTTAFKIGGKVDCALVPSTIYKLSLARPRCMAAGPNERFHQSNPVVRDVEDGRYRMVQLGFDLYHVDCRDSSGATVKVSDGETSWDEGRKLFGDFMALGGSSGTPANVTQDVGRAAAVLSSLPPTDFAAARSAVIQASNTCASYMEQTVLKRGAVTGNSADGTANKPK